jgi:hypothetical protein
MADLWLISSVESPAPEGLNGGQKCGVPDFSRSSQLRAMICVRRSRISFREPARSHPPNLEHSPSRWSGAVKRRHEFRLPAQRTSFSLRADCF